MAFGNITRSDDAETGNTTLTSDASTWTATYTTDDLYQPEGSGDNRPRPTAEKEATLLVRGRMNIESTAQAALCGDIIIGKTNDSKGQLFVQTYETSADISIANNIYLGASSYAQGGAIRFGTDSHKVTMAGVVTLVEDSTIGANSGNEVKFTKQLVQSGGNHALTITNSNNSSGNLNFAAGIAIDTLNVQSGTTVSLSGGSTTLGTLNLTGQSRMTVGTAARVTNTVVEGGSQLRMAPSDHTNRWAATDAVQYTGSVTLAGTSETSRGEIYFEDGSLNISGGVSVNGYGQLTTYWDKNQFVGGFNTVADSGASDLLLTRSDISSWNADAHPRYIYLTDTGNFEGVLHLNYDCRHGHDSAYGLVTLGTTANQNLKNAVISFEGAASPLLAFRNSDAISAADSFANFKTNNLDGKLVDGTVVGLEGKGAVYANTLNLLDKTERKHTFTGTLTLSDMLTLDAQNVGTHRMAMSANPLNRVKVYGGTLELSNTDNEAAMSIAGLYLEGGNVTLDGGKYTVAGNYTGTGDNLQGIFCSAAAGGALTLKNNAELTLNMHPTNTGWDWQFQISTYKEGEGMFIESGSSFTLNTNHAETIQLTALGEETATLTAINSAKYFSYNTSNDGVEIKNALMDITKGSAVSLHNKLTNSSLTYNVVNGTLTLNNAGNSIVDMTVTKGTAIIAENQTMSGSLTAEGLTINANKSLTTAEENAIIGALTLNAGSVLTLGTADGSHTATLTTSSLTVNGTAAINADLVVNGGTITFADNATLTMGCNVIIGSDDTVTVVLTQDMVDTVAATGRYDLFTSVETATLGSHIVFVGADGVTLTSPSVYSLQWDGAKIYVTPEPATATLSLLALAALASRRRRR